MPKVNKYKVICIKKYNLPNSRFEFMKGYLYNLIVWEYKNSNGTSVFQYGLHNDDILIPLNVIENIIQYCENKQIYDKLGGYGDFYYKLKRAIKK